LDRNAAIGLQDVSLPVETILRIVGRFRPFSGMTFQAADRALIPQKRQQDDPMAFHVVILL
jgi:hypothetical protein